MLDEKGKPVSITATDKAHYFGYVRYLGNERTLTDPYLEPQLKEMLEKKG